MSHRLIAACARGSLRWLVLASVVLALALCAGSLAAAQTPSPYDYKVCLPAVSATPGPPTVYSYKILHAYPHDSSAFTEGLFYQDGYLYEGTGLFGQSGVRQVDLASGRVLQSRALAAQYFGEGIAPVGANPVGANSVGANSVGANLVELTWQSHVAFVYDLATFKPTGQQFSYPTEGWGLTTDGNHLIMSDGTAVLHFLDPNTFAETGRVTVTDGGSEVQQLNELEYINGSIYANVWMTERIAIIAPQTGRVTAWIDLRGLRELQGASNPDAVLNGIAYDPKLNRLFVTGKLWPTLYEIQLVLQ